MQKDAYYFPHFCNARHDRKIKRLRKELGLEGYGIYFMLLETLRDQQDLMYPMEDIDLLAEEFGTSEQKIRVTICNYELFELDQDQKFFSPKMFIYLEPYFKMRNQRKEAGLKSAAQRLINDRSTTVQRPFNKGKESKVKESKVKNNKESETFEIFWDKYNKKVDRSKTEIAWSKLKESEVEKILESVDSYVISNPDLQYRKNPLTYLNGKCFNDEVINLKNPINQVALNDKPIIPNEWQ